MRFLCLHGAGTSASILKIQTANAHQTDIAILIVRFKTAALCHEIAKDGVSTFEFVDGEVECDAAPGIAALFPGPYYTYYPTPFSPPPTPTPTNTTTTPSSFAPPPLSTVAEAHALIHAIIADDGPFDGVLGFSQGAALAASILLHHARECPLEPPYALFRFAVFVCGSRPFDYGGRGRLSAGSAASSGWGSESELGSECGSGPEATAKALQDEHDTSARTRTSTTAIREENHPSPSPSPPFPTTTPTPPSTPKPNALLTTLPTPYRIDIPTTHIVGARDAFLAESLGLHALCAPDKAVLLSHPLGHTVPADVQMTRLMAEAVRASVDRVGLGG
ncbi:MAG: hypothetical protein M1819_004561 [Sarea resinae]|nr:MAG: hypothetical protein M1819_004561 [Sarea resinae]